MPGARRTCRSEVDGPSGCDPDVIVPPLAQRDLLDRRRCTGDRLDIRAGAVGSLPWARGASARTVPRVR